MPNKNPIDVTDEQYAHVGRSCKDAVDGNYLVGSFAAELVGESYPFSKEMCDIVFKPYTDLELGKRFALWFNSTNSRSKICF